LEEIGWVERLGGREVEGAAAMEMGAGVGRRRSGKNCLGGLPTSFI
jgi:hypothetical protein